MHLKNVFWILLFSLAACSSPQTDLLEAYTASKSDIRDILEQNIRQSDIPKFVYFDRSTKKVYSLGVKVPGFRFRSTDMARLKLENPGVFHVAECAAGRPCSAASFENCRMSARLITHPDQEAQDRIVRRLKSQGYPVVSVTFTDEGNGAEEIDVTYFTECEWIRHDMEANFSGLLEPESAPSHM